ncbi:DUF7511 domain-containing protein [Natrinema zhouii]|uniref:DUF7511 domain-containing protein n=1 Tax=Natrinema zhouii TaxID=1710539 RepID=UPI003CE4B86D
MKGGDGSRGARQHKHKAERSEARHTASRNPREPWASSLEQSSAITTERPRVINPTPDTLEHTVVEHDDRPDELGVYPRKVENGSFKRWMVAEDGSFVDLANVR